MASRKVDVAGYAGDSVMARLEARPVRLMPSGHAGVVHDGVVYTLYRGDFIALEDQPVEKDGCARFVSVGMPIPYAEEQAPRGSYQQQLEFMSALTPTNWRL